MTFAKERVPSLEGNQEHDTNADMAYQLLPPIRQTEVAPHEMTDWSTPEEEAQTIPDEEDIDLEHPPPLEPHLQELLGEKEPSPAGAGGWPPAP